MALSTNYISNVPQGNQQINNTQEPIKDNFQDIYDLLAVNHVPFNTANTFGRHTFVSYVEQGTDPSTSSTEMALYSKVVPGDPNGAELFYRYPSNGSIVQLTGNSTSTPDNPPTTNTSGGFFNIIPPTENQGGYIFQGFWQYFSGNILYLCGGIANAPITTNPFTITFPQGFSSTGIPIPQFTQPPFNIQIAASYPQNVNSPAGAAISAQVLTSTTASCYYNVSPQPSQIIPQIHVTLIGI